MNNSQFDRIVEHRCDQIKKVLVNKAKEYASNEDRLYNFKVAARMNDTTPLKALWGMATKHLVCVQDLINGKLKITEEVVNEKIGDMINYLILAEALMAEAAQEYSVDYTQKLKRKLEDVVKEQDTVVYSCDVLTIRFLIPFPGTISCIQVFNTDITGKKDEELPPPIDKEEYDIISQLGDLFVVLKKPPLNGSKISIRRKR